MSRAWAEALTLRCPGCAGCYHLCMPVKVMISYSWSDSPARAAVVAKLASIEGVEVLYDKKNILPGGSIHDRISALLFEADFVVAILTPKALTSREVLDELSRAHERRKVIVPVVPETLEPGSLPAHLADTLRIEYRERDIDRTLQDLEDYFKAVVSAKSEEIELKFESTTSLQFKFSAIESSKAVLKKVRALCEILDIEVGRQGDKEIVDEYLTIRCSLSEGTPAPSGGATRTGSIW